MREGWFGCDCLCDFFGDCVLILSCLAVWVLTYAFVVCGWLRDCVDFGIRCASADF